jgi:uncharacterized protein
VYVVNRTRSTYLGVNVKVANTFRSRLLGLRAERDLRFGDGVWLSPCNSIQTMGMRDAIDAVFLDASGRAVRILEGIPPRRFIWRVLGARSTLELSAGVVRSSETKVGDKIEFVAEPVGERSAELVSAD